MLLNNFKEYRSPIKVPPVFTHVDSDESGRNINKYNPTTIQDMINGDKIVIPIINI